MWGRNSVGECHVRNVKVEGSNPFASTKTAQEAVFFTHQGAEKNRFFMPLGY